jgi:hypothetical protein
MAGAAFQSIEQRVVDALPEIADALIQHAKDGDLRAAIYLVDRIFGKSAGRTLRPRTIIGRP